MACLETAGEKAELGTVAVPSGGTQGTRESFTAGQCCSRGLVYESVTYEKR